METRGEDLALNPPTFAPSAKKLRTLERQGWRVIHDVPLDSEHGRIDHLLIGPAGVYTISCRAHVNQKVRIAPMQVTVDDQPVPHLAEARMQARHTKLALDRALRWDVPVRPAVAFYTGAFFPKVIIDHGGPMDVLILYRFGISRMFKDMTRLLDPDQVEEIYGKARWSETWTIPDSQRP